MKTRPTLETCLTAMCLLAGAATSEAQHGHLNAGAFGVNQGDQLNFANGAIFVASSGYVKSLDYSNCGTYASTYNGNISFTALAGTTNFGGPVTGASALGSFLNVRLESVVGPAGGTFNVWDTGAIVPTISMLSGATTPSPMWALSDTVEHINMGLAPAGSPGADPFGHIHGRRSPAFGHAALGAYLQLLIVSVNGPLGGELGFWEEGDTAPRITMAVGAIGGTNQFNLTEVSGASDADPYGHVHGRSFTTTRPGLYTVASASSIPRVTAPAADRFTRRRIFFYLHFQAGLTISSFDKDVSSIVARFGT